MICKQCGKDKSYNEFYTFRRGDKILYRARCKACMLGHEPKELRGIDLNNAEREVVRVTRVKRELDRLRNEPVEIDMNRNFCKDLDKLQAYWQGKVKMTPTEYWDTYYYVYGFIYQMQEKRRMGKIR